MTNPGGVVHPSPITFALDGSGNGSAPLANSFMFTMRIEQFTVVCNPKQSGATFEVQPSWGGLVAKSYLAGTGDVATGPPDYDLVPGDYLNLVLFTGPANGQCIVNYWYRQA